MNNKITVLVPMYNVEEYVDKCLKSIENQTFSDFEVWAVDDGSPDNSKEIVKKYSKIDSRIKLIEKKNGGYGSVLQYGIDHVKSKYILICDPDDWLAKDALEKLYNFAETNNLDLVVGDKYNVYVEDKSIEYQKSFKDNKIIPNKIYSRKEDVQQFSFSEVSPHAKLFKTKILKGIVFPKKVSYTDFVLYILALTKATRVAYLNIALAYYLRNRPGNTATDNSINSVHYNCVVWKSVEQQLSRLSDQDKYKKLWFRMYIQLKSIMQEYGSVSLSPFSDNYSVEVLDLIVLAQRHKKSIKYYITNSIKSRIFSFGLMNKYVYKQFAKIYVKSNSKYYKK